MTHSSTSFRLKPLLELTVFGIIKAGMRFRQFLLRGLRRYVESGRW